MGVLFISHSKNDNDAAIKVRNWLKENGWGQAFLDLDPAHGLAPGHRWQQELKQAGERCSGVLILISPGWITSNWCRTEFLVADQLGKRIFPLFVAATRFDDLLQDIVGRFQFADISTPENEAEGFKRLAIGLKRAGLDPKNFPWPPPDEPQRPIYRGLEALEEQDAAIFFGRDAQITRGLDTLRRMRDGAPERMLVILGASGAGKSSFLKAGLIARLKRDEENFLVLPTIRPERAAISGERGLAASLSSVPEALIRPEDLLEAFLKLRATVVDQLTRYASPHESLAAKLPTIVIPVDQAEELFAAEAAEGEHMLNLLAPAVLGDGNTLMVATIRSDSFEKLQREPRLADISVLPFSLGPIPHGAFKDVIECPARLANPPVSIEPALTERLLSDLADDDALPLLAFTLERLLHRARGRPTLTLANYATELGGLQGAITAAVDAAFANAARDASLPSSRAELEKLARSAFIPALVQIDDADSEPRRRVQQLGAFPEATRRLVRRFVDERLLVCDRREVDGVTSDMVEVAHEAILRQWPTLKTWISEERDALRVLDGVRGAAAEWRKHAARDGEMASRTWLTHRGARLEEAEALMARPDFAGALSNDVQGYILACRANENSENLRERRSLVRTRRLQRRVWILVGIAASLVLIAGFAAAQLLAGLATEAADVLIAESAQSSQGGDYEGGIRYAIAALNRVRWLPHFHDSAQAEAEIRGAAKFVTELAVLRGHTRWVMDASFSPDGRRIVTASRDKTAGIWDARTGSQIVLLRGHTDAVLSAKFSPDGKRVVTASDDKTARIWNAESGTPLQVIGGQQSEMNSAVFSPDGKWILTGSGDKTARIWDSVSGAQRTVLHGHDDAVVNAVFSRDGKRVVTVSGDKTAIIWDSATGKQLAILRGHQATVESASFSPDGKRVATASDDQTVRIWDVDSGRQLAVLSHSSEVNSVAYSSDGKRLVTASADKTARIWDATTGRQLGVFYGHEDVLNGAAFSGDGRRIVTASDDKTARVWDANAGNRLIVLRGHTDWVNSAGFSPDRKLVATASNDKTVRIWDAYSGRQLLQMDHRNLVESVEFSPDGRRVVSGSDDGTARVWDSGTGQQLAVLPAQHDKVYGAAFSPDGKQIVTALTDGTALIWDVAAARVLNTLRGHTEALTSAGFSPDGRRIVTSSRDRTARIWNVANGRCLLVLRGHSDAVTSAAYSSDGKRIVTAGNDRLVLVWDSASGRKLMRLKGHEDALVSAAFSPDGQRIVTASKDNTARIWDAKTALEIAILRGHKGPIESASFSADGRHVVTASADGTARIWNLSGMEATTGSALIQGTCQGVLLGGLSRFSDPEIRAARVLDQRLDGDVCHPANSLARVGRIFWAGVSH